MKLASESMEPTVREQLGRIRTSKVFEKAKRQCELLAYLVDEVLCGRGARIKATSIAIDVFGRDETFDQQNDTIVRVEMGRLRRRLEKYYLQAGAEDPVLFEIPKGSYQPVFTTRPYPDAAIPARGKGQGKSGTGYAVRLMSIATILLALLLAGWQLFDFGETEMANAPSTLPMPDNPTVAMVQKPFLAVLPFEVLSGDEESRRLAFGLVDLLIANLTKLSGMSVMAHSSLIEQDYADKPVTLESLHQQRGVTHVLRGSLGLDGEFFVVNLQLVDAVTGSTIWADRKTSSINEISKLEESLAIKVVSQLSVQIQPDERARLASRHTTENEAWVLYRQGLVMLIPPNDMTRVLTARQLFRRTQEIDARFAGGYAGESFSHSITVLFVKTSEPERELRLALEMAEKAISIDDGFGMAYAVQSFAQAMAGDYRIALQSAQQAVELQPGDAFTRFILGMNQVISGQPEAAIVTLNEALRLDPLEARTPYLNTLGIAYYSADQCRESLEAMEFNDARGGPGGPHMAVFKIACYLRLDRREQAQGAYASLREKSPGFPVEAWLGNWLQRGKVEQTLELLGGLEH